MTRATRAFKSHDVNFKGALVLSTSSFKYRLTRLQPQSIHGVKTRPSCASSNFHLLFLQTFMPLTASASGSPSSFSYNGLV